MSATVLRVFLACIIMITVFNLIECKGGRGGGGSSGGSRYSHGSRNYLGGTGYYSRSSHTGGMGSRLPGWAIALIVVLCVGTVCSLIYFFLCCRS